MIQVIDGRAAHVKGYVILVISRTRCAPACSVPQYAFAPAHCSHLLYWFTQSGVLIARSVYSQQFSVCVASHIVGHKSTNCKHDLRRSELSKSCDALQYNKCQHWYPTKQSRAS